MGLRDDEACRLRLRGEDFSGSRLEGDSVGRLSMCLGGKLILFYIETFTVLSSIQNMI